MNQILIEELNSEILTATLLKFKAKNILLVTTKNSYYTCGASELIKNSNSNKYNFYLFQDFEVNVKFEDVLIGASKFKENNCNFIIAIGGGSVIDMAKSINAIQSNFHNPQEVLILENKISNAGVPLFAIPTTSGSGSEATHFAVVYHKNKKYSLSHTSLLPTIVGFDYNLTKTLNKYQSTVSGLDALAQAIESYWSVNSTTESLIYAELSIRLILSNLEKFVINPNDYSRKIIQLASFYSGKAINISKTTAPHAISYAFTTYYSIPHGHAVFLTLPSFLKFNAEINTKDNNDLRGLDFVNNQFNNLLKIFNVEKINEAMDLFNRLALNLGIETKLSKLGVTNLNLIINNVNIERLSNNPRKINKQQIESILQNIY